MVADRDYMRRALLLAERGRGRTSPNPMVGAVVVTPDGVVVGAGYHGRAGGPHAEVHALAAAGDRARGATLYCTLEPCCHTGRTGPCTTRILDAGIARVVSAVVDPNLLVAGGGLAMLRARGVRVDEGVCGDEAARLNEAFFTFVRARRPYVLAKIAMSLDARIAGPHGARRTITSTRARRQVQLLRAEVDAIGVGSGTILCDDPLLTAREVYRARPLTRVIFDRRLRTPASARLFSTLDAGPLLVVTTEAAVRARPADAAALGAAGAQIESLSSGSIESAMTRLADRGITSLLLEGGAEMHRAAWRARVVDRVLMFVAPGTMDEGPRWLGVDEVSLRDLHELRVTPCGPDMLIDGYVHRAH